MKVVFYFLIISSKNRAGLFKLFILNKITKRGKIKKKKINIKYIFEGNILCNERSGGK